MKYLVTIAVQYEVEADGQQEAIDKADDLLLTETHRSLIEASFTERVEKVEEKR